MKRTIALVLAVVSTATLLTGCFAKEEDPAPVVGSTLPTTSTTATSAGQTSYTPPVGYVYFGTLDAAGNVVVDGLTFLLSATGATVAVDRSSLLTANTTAGVVTSVSDAEGRSFTVLTNTAEGVTSLYGKEGDSAADASVVDVSTPSGIQSLAPIPSVKTTKSTTKTTKKPVTVKPPQSVNVVTTSTLSPEQQAILDEKNKIQNSNMSTTEKQLAFNLLNYKMDENGIFYVDHQPWQKQFGFNQIYDLASPLIQLVYATIRVKFRYGYVYKLYPKGHEKQGQVMYENGKPLYELDAKGDPIPKDWMVQLWKGRYGMVMLGGEIGVYTKPSTQTSAHYYSAVAEEELVMAMDCYQKNFTTGNTKKLFTRGPESAWWLTGFVPGSFFQYNNKPEVIMVGSIQFPDAEMLNQFIAHFTAAGFKEGAVTRDTPETYTTNGSSVKFCWQYIDQDG
ncbi:MAG: DUF4474 domain-containing protein [Oscillospiraceae bacterium]|jgi:hypothetical protein|nr:DUF4474 domain-containing protein [Oscillospiraceae bacterium]